MRRLADPAIRAEMRKEMETGTGWENWYAHAGKDWDRIIVVTRHPDYQKYNGTSIENMARQTGKDAWEVFFALAQAETDAMPQSMSEANKMKAMREEFTSFDTDAGPAGTNLNVHPRAYGAFPRLFSRYVRDLGALTLEGAVHRAAAVAANEIGAYDRGRLAPGLAADIVVFDPVRIRDRATFAEPTLPSEGVEFVVVNGVSVLEHGKYTGAKPGKVLRGPGWDGKP
jgi:N-acyl-D-amino-acid deacylase